DPAWHERLVIRVPGSAGLSMAREAAVLTFLQRHDYAAPRLVQVLADSDNVLGSPAVVSTRPTGSGMLERIARQPDCTNAELTRLGLMHATLHDLPLDSLDIVSAVPALDLGVELMAIDNRVFREEIEWLASSEPAAAPKVLC